MSFVAQVAHIFVKDVRRLRWMLVVFGGLSAIGFLRAIDVLHDAEALVGLNPTLLMIAVMAVAVMLVQEDSPVRQDAYWLTRPISPRAMVAAKLMELLVVVLPVALLQFIALYRLTYSTSVVMQQVFAASIALTITLVLAAALAANTRDFRTAVMAGLVLLISCIVVPSMWNTAAVTDEIKLCALTAGAAGGIASTYWLFTKRDWRVVPAMTGVLSLYLVVFGFTVSASTVRNVILSLDPSPVVIDTAPLRGINPWNMSALRYRRVADSRERLVVRGMSVTQLPRDGERTVGYEQSLWQPVGDFDPRVIRDVQWLNAREGGTSLPTDYSSAMVVGTSNPDAPASGDTLMYSGRVDAMMPRVIVEFPLSETTPVTTRNAQLSIELPSEADARAMLALKIRSISGWFNSESWFNGQGAPTYALFNESRNQGVILRPYATAHVGTTMLLPTLATTEVSYKFSVDSATYASLESPLEWVRESKLAIIAWDPVTSYKVTYTYIVP